MPFEEIVDSGPVAPYTMKEILASARKLDKERNRVL